MKNRITALLVALAIIMSSFTIPVYALDADADLVSIASDTIQITELTDENGTVTTTYDNLDGFRAAARSVYPDLSDYEIAIFTLNYTNQEYDGLPESEILRFLDYNNLTTSCSYIRVNDQGYAYVSDANVLPYADWTSGDGYMKITTNYSHLKTVGDEKHYSVSARATWLICPIVKIRDTFVLGTSGAFDDSYDEYAGVFQTYYCRVSNSTMVWNRQVSNTKQTDGDLSFVYDNHVPEVHFTPLNGACSDCTAVPAMREFSVFVRYGMIADETVNIQAGYGHKTLGIGDVYAGIDLNGTPSFSTPIGTVVPYTARAVTVAY